MSGPAFDPQAAGFYEDPYAQYARLREHDPVHLTPAGVPMCFAYDDIRQVLLDQSTSMVPEPARSLALLGRDPPDHTRVRRLMSKAFTPRRIDRLSTWIEGEVDRLLSEIATRSRDGEPVDLVDDFAFPLPFSVISEILGMPEGDDQQVRAWAHDVASATDPIMVSQENLARSAAAMKGITDYVTDEVLPWKREHLAEDLLSELLAAFDEGALVSQAELLDQVTLLYMAGHETTVGLIGNSIFNLLQHRAQLERIVDDPALVPNAIEELSRYDSPIQFTWRITVDELTIRDVTVPPRTTTFLCVGSANRDPEHFGEDASTLDVTRPNAAEALSFGGGVHFCLGASLARRETTLAVSELFRRFPKLELVEDPRWQHRITFRSVDHLVATLN
jgi:cytochrome P450